MSNEEEIKRQRDAAFSMQIGTKDDSSAIKEMISTDSILYAVTEKSIYGIKLADQIDPSRKNSSIPPAVQQKVLAYGTSDELVGRILLTAYKLFVSPYLIKEFDQKRALALSFDVLKEVIFMRELAEGFKAEEERAANAYLERLQANQPFVMPAVTDSYQRCKNYIQKSDHALQALFEIVKLFYGDAVGKKWFESLYSVVVEKYGDADLFSEFLKENLPFLKFVRNMRNYVEHPKPTERIEVTDFAIAGKDSMNLPMIEVISPEIPQAPVSISMLMHHTVKQISGIFESLCVLLCAKHMRPFSGFNFSIIEFPEEQRTNKFVRYGYGLYDGERIIRAD